MSAIIRCDGVWKRYRLRTSSYQTLRDDLAVLLGRLNPFAASKDGREFLWALQDVALEVSPGEALGIIGANGSGKSTLLKLLAGVTYPTRGLVEVRGRVGPLIEVGAGIHPELTGRENIHLYGTIIGLRRQEILQKFDAIVAFSELEKFLDVPVKRYSSGMKIRLGFSIAAHADPDILLVDEVLAVGDAAFQRKCLDKITSMLDSGTTILYVSHELSALERLCPQALWLDAGAVREVGASPDVVQHYLREVQDRLAERAVHQVRSPGGFVVEGVSLDGEHGANRAHVRSGDPLTVSVHYSCPATFEPAQVAIKILNDRMITIATAVWENGTAGTWRRGEGTIRCSFASLPLAPRIYQLWVQVLRADFRPEIPWTPVTTFVVIAGGARAADRIHLPRGREMPVLALPATWQVDGGEPVRSTASTTRGLDPVNAGQE